MIDYIDVYTHPHAVGSTEATAYGIVTIRSKDWWLCINDDGTPFFLSVDGNDDEH